MVFTHNRLCFSLFVWLTGSESCCLLSHQSARSAPPQSSLGHSGCPPSAWVSAHTPLAPPTHPPAHLHRPLMLFISLLFLISVADFQGMPNAVRPSAPRPQTYGGMRPTSQVPRVIAPQRMGEPWTSRIHTQRQCCNLAILLLNFNY